MSEEETGSVITGSSETAPTTEIADTPTTETATVDWKGSLPDDLKLDPSLTDIKDVESLAKSYVHGQKMIGKDRIALPGKEATDEEWGTFYNDLGRPATPQDYKFGERPTLPEGMVYDDDFEKEYRDMAHGAGLTTAQAKALYDNYNGYMANKSEVQGETLQAQRTEWRDSLKKEFGKAYDERIDLAKRAVETYGDGNHKEWLNVSGMGDNPMMVKLFATIGSGLAEGKSDAGADRAFVMTPDQAQAEIARHNRDEDFTKAYHDSEHASHAAAVVKMDNLFKMAYPDETPIT